MKINAQQNSICTRGNTLWQATILGEPASKANSRKLVTVHGRPLFIKSEKARGYESDFLAQARPLADGPIEGKLAFTGHFFYRTERPDLDASLVFDCLQKAGVIRNDRQIRAQHIYHGIDKDNPRAEIRLESLE